MNARRRKASWSARLKRLGFALLPMLLATALVAVAMTIRVTTPIELDIHARAVAFTVAGDRPVPVLNNSTVFASLGIEGCNTVSFPPLNIGIDPAPLPSPKLVRFSCDTRVPGSKVLIRRSDELGSIGRILAQPGDRVALELINTNPPALRIEVSRNVSFEFSLRRDIPFEIVTEFVRVDGVPAPADPDGVVTYLANLPGSSTDRLASVESGPDLNIVVQPAGDPNADLFRPDIDIPVASISLFQRSDVDDAFVSTAVEGVLAYQGRPDTESVQINTGEDVRLRSTSPFRIARLRVDRANPQLWFQLSGDAAELAIAAQDRRLTLLDRVVSDRTSGLVGIIAVLASQLVWLRRFLWPASNETAP